MPIDNIKFHVRYKSAQLFTVGSRTYFEYNGKSYQVKKTDVKKLLNEIEKNDFNFLTAANYLIKESKKGRFTIKHR
jgi:hypothetical protein